MLVATSLSGIEIGGKWDQALSARFLAKTWTTQKTNFVSAIRPYEVTMNPPGETGYASGTGGTFNYALCADNAGVPGKILADISQIIDFPTENGRGGFPLIAFRPTLVNVGSYYHFVARNIDLHSDVNWHVIDFLTDAAVLNQTPDIQLLVSATGTPWKPVNKGAAMASPFAIFYADGTVQGYKAYQVGPEGLLTAEAYGFPPSLIG